MLLISQSGEKPWCMPDSDGSDSLMIKGAHVKGTFALTACLALCACSAADPGQSLPPAINETPSTFLGLTLGLPVAVPDCSRYSDEGEYKVASFQEVTPCLMRDRSRVVAVDGVSVKPDPSAPVTVGILFSASQVPEGMGTSARVTFKDDLLSEVSLPFSAHATGSDYQAINKMLREKYGPVTHNGSGDGLLWRLSGMVVLSLPPEAGNPGRVIAMSNAHLDRLMQARQGHSATSF